MFMDDFREPVKLCENCMNILFFFLQERVHGVYQIPKRSQNEVSKMS